MKSKRKNFSQRAVNYRNALTFDEKKTSTMSSNQFEAKFLIEICKSLPGKAQFQAFIK